VNIFLDATPCGLSRRGERSTWSFSRRGGTRRSSITAGHYVGRSSWRNPRRERTPRAEGKHRRNSTMDPFGKWPGN
jgi:hypothetical protein